MKVDLDNYFRKMIRHEKGFWINETGAEQISYPEHGNELYAEIEENSFWFSHRNEVIISAVRKFPPGGMIFDIGGGNGYVAKGLADAGLECALVEPGEKGAAKAVERGVRNVFCATLESMNFEKKSIPAVGLFDVVEHIEDDLSFLKEIHSLMVPGGRLYATVPAYNFLWSQEDVFAGHFRRHTKGTISRVLKTAGFEVEYLTYFFRFLPPAIFLYRTLPSFLGVKAKSSEEESKNSHAAQGGASSKLLNKLLKDEIDLIRAGKRMAFGGSCFVVARS